MIAEQTRTSICLDELAHHLFELLRLHLPMGDSHSASGTNSEAQRNVFDIFQPVVEKKYLSAASKTSRRMASRISRSSKRATEV